MKIKLEVVIDTDNAEMITAMAKGEETKRLAIKALLAGMDWLEFTTIIVEE